MIVGAHVMVQSSNYNADKAFFRDVLGLPSVDAGGGFLLFGVPPSEIAVHESTSGGTHEMFLMCDDVHATTTELKRKGVELSMPISESRVGTGHPSEATQRRREGLYRIRREFSLESP